MASHLNHTMVMTQKQRPAERCGLNRNRLHPTPIKEERHTPPLSRVHSSGNTLTNTLSYLRHINAFLPYFIRQSRGNGACMDFLISNQRHEVVADDFNPVAQIDTCLVFSVCAISTNYIDQVRYYLELSSLSLLLQSSMLYHGSIGCLNWRSTFKVCKTRSSRAQNVERWAGCFNNFLDKPTCPDGAEIQCYIFSRDSTSTWRSG